MPEVIADGYTRRVIVKGKPGLHEDFQFEYRPLSGAARQTLLRRVESAGIQERPKLINAHLAKQIIAWDFTEQGEPLPITLENCERLEGNYWTALYNVSIGFTQPDAVLSGLGAPRSDVEDEGDDIPN